MKRGNFLIALLVLGLTIGVVSSYSIFVTPLNNGELSPKTVFNYMFNFTLNEDCTNPVLSYSNETITDYTGRSFFDIDLSPMTEIPKFLCESRDNVLKKVHKFPDMIFGRIYGQSLNVSENVTGSWFNGKINASNVINPIWLTNESDPLFNSSYPNIAFLNQSNHFLGNLSIDGTLKVGNKTGLTGNYSLGNCWVNYFGGLAYDTNCPLS